MKLIKNWKKKERNKERNKENNKENNKEKKKSKLSIRLKWSDIKTCSNFGFEFHFTSFVSKVNNKDIKMGVQMTTELIKI